MATTSGPACQLSKANVATPASLLDPEEGFSVFAWSVSVGQRALYTLDIEYALFSLLLPR